MNTIIFIFKKGGATRQNIQKQVLKVQKLYYRIDNIRTDYIKKIVAEIVKPNHRILRLKI